MDAGSTPPPAAGTTRPPAAGSPAPAATPPSRPATAAPAPLAPTPQPLNPRGRALAALDGVELQLAGAYALVADNRISDGRARALQAGLLFEQAVSPLLTRLDPPAAERASRLFASLEGGGLLAPDVGVLISEMERARAALNASTAGGARHELVAGLQPVWAGWLRGLLFILTCVLFAYPVYLMNLSFGGRNPHWRLVSAALLLLFVAPVLEGLAWLGPRLAETTGLASLEGAAALSILNNPLAQLAWAASLLLAVLLALAGFRGIASQFGLLGRRSAATTVLEAPAVALVGGRASGETIIEWDEEL